MTHSREISPSPPVTFPVYGLDASWSGSRWLDGFGDRIGEEVRWVRLAHQSLETGALIMVETRSGPLTDSRATLAREHPLQSVAFSASVMMVNVTLPTQLAPRPRGLLHALVNDADASSREYAQWSPVSWWLDSAEARARARRFAGGWAAYSGAADGVYLAAAGLGIDPDGLALTALRDGCAYNFDLDQPLRPGIITASRAARAGGERLPPLRPDWHADQLRLMPSQP